MRNTTFTLIGLVILLAGVGLADTAKNFQFVDEFGYPRTDATYVYVYNAGTLTASTLYQGPGRQTAITNPMTPTSTATTLLTHNGFFSFYDNVNNHDIIANVGGLRVRFENVSPQDTRLVVPRAAYPSFNQKKGGYQLFRQTPGAGLSTGAAPGGTAGNVNILTWPNFTLEAFVIGTQTILVPPISASGLNITYDLTNNEGIELSTSMLASSLAGFTIGTDGPFHFKAKLKISGVMHSDETYVGFRLAEAGQAAIATYKDLAALNCNAGNIYTVTNLNDASAVTATDTTNNWVAEETHTFEVYVSQAGVVTFKIDGVAPITTQEFTFDSGDVVIPFIRILHDSSITAGDAIYLIEWDCGLDAD